jgi:hypothetical protein
MPFGNRLADTIQESRLLNHAYTAPLNVHAFRRVATAQDTFDVDV